MEGVPEPIPLQQEYQHLHGRLPAGGIGVVEAAARRLVGKTKTAAAGQAAGAADMAAAEGAGHTAGRKGTAAAAAAAAAGERDSRGKADTAAAGAEGTTGKAAGAAAEGEGDTRGKADTATAALSLLAGRGGPPSSREGAAPTGPAAGAAAATDRGAGMQSYHLPAAAGAGAVSAAELGLGHKRSSEYMPAKRRRKKTLLLQLHEQQQQRNQQQHCNKDSSSTNSKCVQVEDGIYQYQPPRRISRTDHTLTLPGKLMSCLYPGCGALQMTMQVRVLVPVGAASMAAAVMSGIGLRDGAERVIVTAAAAAGRKGGGEGGGGEAGGAGAGAGGAAAAEAGAGGALETKLSAGVGVAAVGGGSAGGEVEDKTGEAPPHHPAVAAAVGHLEVEKGVAAAGGAQAATAAGAAAATTTTAAAATAEATDGKQQRGKVNGIGADMGSSSGIVTKVQMIAVHQAEVQYVPSAPGVRANHVLTRLKHSLGAFWGWRITFISKVRGPLFRPSLGPGAREGPACAEDRCMVRVINYKHPS